MWQCHVPTTLLCNSEFILLFGLTIFLRVLSLLESEKQLRGWSFPVRKAITGACFYLTTYKDAYQHDPTYPCESCSNTVLFDSQYDSACREITSLKQLVASCHGTATHFVGIRRDTGRDVYRCQLSKESTVDYEDKINQSQKLFLSPTLPKQSSLRQHIATSSS